MYSYKSRTKSAPTRMNSRNPQIESMPIQMDSSKPSFTSPIAMPPSTPKKSPTRPRSRSPDPDPGSTLIHEYIARAKRETEISWHEFYAQQALVTGLARKKYLFETHPKLDPKNKPWFFVWPKPEPLIYVPPELPPGERKKVFARCPILLPLLLPMKVKYDYDQEKWLMKAAERFELRRRYKGPEDFVEKFGTSSRVEDESFEENVRYLYRKDSNVPGSFEAKSRASGGFDLSSRSSKTFVEMRRGGFEKDSYGFGSDADDEDTGPSEEGFGSTYSTSNTFDQTRRYQSSKDLGKSRSTYERSQTTELVKSTYPPRREFDEMITHLNHQSLDEHEAASIGEETELSEGDEMYSSDSSEEDLWVLEKYLEDRIPEEEGDQLEIEREMGMYDEEVFSGPLDSVGELDPKVLANFDRGAFIPSEAEMGR